MTQPSHTEGATEAEREAFEAWAGSTDSWIPNIKRSGARYVSAVTAAAWHAWEARAALSGWHPIATAPRDGTRFIAYRPLALRTHDPEVSLVQGSEYDRGCWDATVPDGMDSSNFTSGYCKATHWMPLPALPAPNQGAES